MGFEQENRLAGLIAERAVESFFVAAVLQRKAYLECVHLVVDGFEIAFYRTSSGGD